ncbi:lantibiotic dehydratase C-terminal domain-containing protein [Paenibacillus zanthoxyli]|uniref:lantibiotic dehydratase C-terminal domain-containing protein n=1 Tax=Paenibacillus zanthoxyli TaxID=369399 RepID=UPI0038CD9BC0
MEIEDTKKGKPPNLGTVTFLLTTTDFINIIGSLIHLHFNRLFEVDRSFEDKLCAYAYQTLYGQRMLRKRVQLQEI